VVDNGSTDQTSHVVRSTWMPHIALRYINEPQLGQSNARNRGLVESVGEVILFTDDDVHVPRHWIEAMCAPILSQEAEVVAGGICLAKHLVRPWMKTLHYEWLASTERTSPEGFDQCYGANMAFSRSVLNKVPAFDRDLGPGALGQFDDTLFIRQLQRAGFRLKVDFGVQVEHHCEVERLKRKAFLKTANRQGRCNAYVRYHWEHHHEFGARDRGVAIRRELSAIRRRSWRHLFGIAGAPEWELKMESEAAYFEQWTVEEQRDRLYDRFGAVKLDRKSSQNAVIG